MFGGHARSVLVAASGALLAAGLLGACSAGGGGDEAGACDVLDQRLASSTFGPDETNLNAPPSTRTGNVLAWMLEVVDPSSSTVLVYLDPGSSDADLEAMAAEIEARPGVTSTDIADADESYREFRRLFEGNREMLDNVRPEDLPPSVRVEVAHDDAGALVTWATDERGVFEVRDRADPARAVLVGTLTEQSDRDAWADVAQRLDRVEGDPAWSTTGAAAIRRLLEDGPRATVGDPAAITAAREQLETAMAGCRPG